VGIAPAEGAQALAALAAFRRSGLLGPAGVATTDAATGQQWDAPNAWPPLQDIVIEALENYGGETRLPLHWERTSRPHIGLSTAGASVILSAT
jgi:neutral trehalase